MKYWRYFVSAAFMMVAINVTGTQRIICLACAVLCVIWGMWYSRHLNRKRAEFEAKHPYFDPDYEFIICTAEHTDLSDEEGDRQEALRRFKQRSHEFAGDIMAEVRKIGGEDTPRFGVYINGTRMGDIPEEYNAFLLKRASQLETFNKIKLTGGDTDDSGQPFGLELSLRFPRDTYTTPQLPEGGGMLRVGKGGLFS